MTLDIELNKEGDKTTDVIQIGFCVANMETGLILEEGSIFVKPTKPLDPFIIGLTGITQAQIDEHAIDLVNAYEILSRIHVKHACFCNPITWGGGDSEAIRTRLGLGDQKFIFGRRWIDTKTLMQSYCAINGMKLQGGLAKSLGKMGLAFKGKKHNAMDDAKNTWILYWKLIQYFKKEVKNASLPS